ncbi:winged helix-turn-helix domain-containing protein [Flagellimonas meishanensis]|uniref:winged helix-turn-helix domain-containing protein n=1 Tax=Flagellimonas meishanensis TaxID=2873264 RepID=UPI001CA6653B|nr:winged helix-turn-helix domain-containing protein [[Muricauda] meishanensis]
MKINIEPDIIAYPNSNELEFIGKGSERIRIEPLAMDLLIYLLNKNGEVCTPLELIETLWDGNQYVGKPSLRKMVYKLRLTFKRFNKNNLIETIPKKGYRLVCGRVNHQKKSHSLSKTKWSKILYVIFTMVLFVFLMKLIFPEFFHTTVHRLGH